MSNIYYKGMAFLKLLVHEFSNQGKQLQLSVVMVEIFCLWFLIMICSWTAN